MGQKLLIAAICGTYALYAMACAASRAAVPGDLLGLTVGMTRQAAGERLNDIGRLERTETGRQELWRLNDDPKFSTAAVGYDKEDRIRYVTAFVDTATARERIAFTSVGDLSSARSEILEPHHRYIWDVRSVGAGQPSLVNVYGDNADFVTIYTLSRRPSSDAPIEEEDD